MREIEIKARIADKDAVRAKLETLGFTFGGPLKQHDVVYGQRLTKDGKWGRVWLRIRTENEKTVLFTLKKSIVGHLDSAEHEVEVSNSIELEAIIKLLGFELYSDLTKIRYKAKLDETEVCLDSVRLLGDFIEAEKLMSDDADHDEVVDELWTLFSRLGISKAEACHEGYDVMLLNKLKDSR